MISEGTFVLVGLWFTKKVGDVFISALSKPAADKEKITKKFVDTIDKVSQEFQGKYPDLLGGSIEYFFQDELVFEELLKMLFKSSDLDVDKIKENFHLESLPPNFIENFIDTLRQELYKIQEFDELFSSKKIYNAVFGLSEDIANIKNHTEETKEELKTVNKILNDNFVSFDFSHFFTTYKKNALNNLSEVNFFGLGIASHIKKSRKKLQDIFIKPKFDATAKKLRYKKASKIRTDRLELQEESRTILYSKIFNNLGHKVVLGNPGSGKSFFTKSVICAILQNEKKEFSNPEILKFLPIRIELRKYLMLKKENNYNSIKILEHIFETEYSLSNLNENCIVQILTNKKVLIFFDGLDEIFDVKDKLEVKRDIENITNNYSNIVAIVTSRKIGYEEAAMNDNFEVLTIRDFDNKQIIQYVNKWYRIEEPDPDTRKREISLLIDQKNNIDEELVRNPLLLSLIVILYRNNLKIPESKLEIYKSCTKTLVEKWDETKELKINIDERIKNRKETLFADLAFWQYEKLSKKEEGAVITNAQVLNTIKNSIVTKLKLTEDWILASKWAEEFMNYAEKRSLYFDNNFTHKTFLEFYTAFYIYTNFEKKGRFDERNNLVRKYNVNSYWNVVLELLVNFIDEDQADNQVIDEFIESQLIDLESSNFLLLILTNLKNVSLDVVKKVFHNSIIYCIRALKYEDSFIGSRDKSPNILIYDIMSRLQLYGINDKFNDELNSTLLSVKDSLESETELIHYYILLVELSTFTFFHAKQPKRKYEEFIVDLEEFKNLRKQNSYLYTLSIKFDSFEIDEFSNYIRYFGTEKLFAVRPSYFTSIGYGPFIAYFYFNQFKDENIGMLFENLEKLEQVGMNVDLLINNLLYNHHMYYFDNVEINIESLFKNVARTSNNKFVLFILLIIFYSLRYRSKNQLSKISKDRILSHFEKSEKRLVVDYVLNNYQKDKQLIFKEIFSLLGIPEIKI